MIAIAWGRVMTRVRCYPLVPNRFGLLYASGQKIEDFHAAMMHRKLPSCGLWMSPFSLRCARSVALEVVHKTLDHFDVIVHARSNIRCGRKVVGTQLMCSFQQSWVLS